MADTVDLTDECIELSEQNPVPLRAIAPPKPSNTDEIDLTEDSPRNRTDMNLKPNKRASAEASVESDGDFHRRRIMAFASNVASNKRQRAEAESIAPALAAVSIRSTSPAKGPARKVRRTQGPDEIVVNNPVPPHPEPSAAHSQPESSGPEVGTPGTEVPPANLLLAQLHAERMARQRAREAAGESSQPRAVGAALSNGTINITAGKDPATQATSSEAAPVADERAKGKTRREGIVDRPAGTGTGSGTSEQPSSSGNTEVTEFDLLTYNIWFSSDAMGIRMKAIGEIIKSLNYPSFICLQEVTGANLALLRKQPFWNHYTHSPIDHYATYFTMILCHKEKLGSPVSFFNNHFPNSVMGRSLLGGCCKLGGTDVCISTVHLESPCNGQKFSEPRKAQLRMGLEMLDSRPEANTLMAGDTNWNTEDGPMVLDQGWKDVWLEKRPGQDGWTYNCKENAMLMGSWPPQRFDRIVYKMPDWEPSSIEIVGNTPLPNATYQKQLRNGATRKMQVLPSDHYGVHAKFVRNRLRVP